MNRREVIAVLGGAVVAWPLTARAQQAMPVVGFLHQAEAANNAPFVAVSEKVSESLGYVKGRNVMIEYRWAEGHYDRLPGLAADLVLRPVAAICAVWLPAALAVKAVGRLIPARAEIVPVVTMGSELKAPLIGNLSRLRLRR